MWRLVQWGQVKSAARAIEKVVRSYRQVRTRLACLWLTPAFSRLIEIRSLSVFTH
jgi:hypothetical protein